MKLLLRCVLPNLSNVTAVIDSIIKDGEERAIITSERFHSARESFNYGRLKMEESSMNYQPETQTAVLDVVPQKGDDWPTKIEKVLEQRKPYAAWLRNNKSYLKNLQAELEDLERQKNKLAGDPAFQPYIERLPFGELANRAREQQQRLDELGRRFERPTLNVAVVGMVNQGKSFLLRTLSGLPPEVIPDRGKEHEQLAPMTGARSTIINEACPEIRGRVSFYSESSLLAVLDAYRAELLKAIGRVVNIPFATPYSSLEDFRQRPLPPEAFQAAQPARYEALLRQLRKYKLLLSHDQSHIGRAPLEDVPVSELARYVTQNATAGDQAYLYLAVEKVEIWCQFPHEGVGKIALIDMPGLGEVTLGGPERVLEALRLDADVALFVWRVMPNDTLHEGESLVSLYDTCYQAMKHTLPLNEWSFLVLNYDRKRANMKECEEALEKVREPGSAFKFFAEGICDCSSQEEVCKHVLSPILNYLTERLGDLDRRVAASCTREIEELTGDASAALRKARASLGDSADSLDDKEFEDLFDRKWNALRLGLNNLVADLREQVDAPVDSFIGQVKEALDACRRRMIVPGEEEVRKHLQADSSYDRVLETRRIWMRSQISRSLHGLDTALDQPLADVKSRVAQVFDVDGGFGRLVGENGLENLAERLAPHSPSLRTAFDNLNNFHMSARGLIGYKIRVRLQALEPRKSLTEPAPGGEEAQSVEMAAFAEQSAEGKDKKFRIKNRKDTRAEKSNTHEQGDGGVVVNDEDTADGHGVEGGAQIHRHLSSLFESTLAEIAVALGEDFSRPNQVGYAIVADFVDDVVHDRQSEMRWRNVYRNLREFVWPTDYELQQRRQRARSQWCASLEKTSQVVRQDSHTLPAQGFAGTG